MNFVIDSMFMIQWMIYRIYSESLVSTIIHSYFPSISPSIPALLGPGAIATAAILIQHIVGLVRTGSRTRTLVLVPLVGGRGWHQRESPLLQCHAAAANSTLRCTPFPTGHLGPTSSTASSTPNPRNAGTDQGLLLAAVLHRLRQPRTTPDGPTPDKCVGSGSQGRFGQQANSGTTPDDAGDAVFAGTFVISRKVVKILFVIQTYGYFLTSQLNLNARIIRLLCRFKTVCHLVAAWIMSSVDTFPDLSFLALSCGEHMISRLYISFALCVWHCGTISVCDWFLWMHLNSHSDRA